MQRFLIPTLIRELHLREPPSEGRTPPTFDICRCCNAYIWPGEVECLIANADVAMAAKHYEADAARRKALMAKIKGTFDRAVR